MIHARKDYDRIQDPDNKIPIDEPVFLLRGQDPTAWPLVLEWLARQEGSTYDHRDETRPSATDGPLAVALKVHAAKMRHWAQMAKHGPATVSADQLRLW